MSSHDIGMHLNSFTWNWVAGLKFIQAFVSLGLGIFVISKNPRNWLLRSYFIFTLCVFLWLGALGLAMMTRDPWLHLFLNRNFAQIGVCSIGPSIVWLTASLQGVAYRHRFLIFFNYFIGAVFYILFHLIPDVVFSTKVVEYDWGVYIDVRDSYYFIFYVPFVLQLVGSLISFWPYYKNNPSPVERNKVKYMAVGFLTIYIGSVDWLPAYGIDVAPVGHFFALGFDVIVAYAILSNRLFNIETVFLKTVVVTVTSLILFLPIGWLAVKYRDSVFGLSDSGFLVTLFICFTFVISASHQVNNFVENIVDGHRRKLNAAFVGIIRDLSVLNTRENIAKYIRDSADGLISPQFLLMYTATDLTATRFVNVQYDQSVLANHSLVSSLRRSQGFVMTEVPEDFALTQKGATIWFPLHAAGILIGFIGIGPKKDSSHYRPAEIEFFSEFCRVTAMALKNALLLEKSMAVERRKMASFCEIAGGIAHEVNNPLMIIRASAQKINYLAAKKQEVGMQFDLTETTKTITSTVDRIADIVKELQIVARQEKVKQKELVDIVKLVRDTLDNFRDRFARSNVKVTESYPGNKVLLPCRLEEVTQALANLLSNALDAVIFTNPRWIDVTCEICDDDFHIVITDSGNGIPDNIADKIMDPFFTTKGVGRGTGLGLSLSKSLIESHNGRLYLDRTAKNTRFVIELPHAPIEVNVS